MFVNKLAFPKIMLSCNESVTDDKSQLGIALTVQRSLT